MEQLRNLEKAVLPKLLEEVNRRGESIREDAKNGVLKEKIKKEVVEQNIVEGSKPMVASPEVMKTKKHQKWVYLHEFPINQNALEEK